MIAGTLFICRLEARATTQFFSNIRFQVAPPSSHLGVLITRRVHPQTKKFECATPAFPFPAGTLIICRLEARATTQFISNIRFRVAPPSSHLGVLKACHDHPFPVIPAQAGIQRHTLIRCARHPQTKFECATPGLSRLRLRTRFLVPTVLRGNAYCNVPSCACSIFDSDYDYDYEHAQVGIFLLNTQERKWLPMNRS